MNNTRIPAVMTYFRKRGGWRRAAALGCAWLMAAAPVLPSDRIENGIRIHQPTGGKFGAITRQYLGREVDPVKLANSSRLDSLMRGGMIYLSLQDAVALALENNLDIAVQRYGPLISEADLLRAESGGLLRGVSQSVQQGAAGGGQGVSGGALGSATGGAASGGGASSTSVNGIISQLGPTTPNLDPVLQGFAGFFHNTSPQTSTFLTGTTSLVSNTRIYNFTLTQGFLSGGQASLAYDSRILDQNSIRNSINPSASVALDLIVTQNLLQGFGYAVNSRNIRVARNERKISALVFREQVIATVSNIVQLYWNLVSFNESVKYANRNLALSQKTYDDNRKQVEIGTLAPIEITRAEAEVAARQQDVTVAETNVLQQETVIKNALSRNGVATPAVSAARIVPTDVIRVPREEAAPPIQELFAAALKQRPEIEQTAINVENSRIQLVGQKNGLLPTVVAFGELTNNGLSGSANSATTFNQFNPPPDPYFVGGYGTAAGQVFRRNFPNYSIGAQFNIPLRNRAAQADYVYSTLQIRQNELSQQKQINQVRVDVENAVIGIRQARARYQSALKQRVLQEQTLDAEQKKYKLGASTIFLVIQAQRDLAQAQSNEVTAETQYVTSRLQLDVSTGQIVPRYHIDLGEALNGSISQAPAPLPPESK